MKRVSSRLRSGAGVMAVRTHARILVALRASFSGATRERKGRPGKGPQKQCTTRHLGRSTRT